MNHILERIYGAMPVGVQHVLCSAEGYRITRRRSGRAFDRVVHETESRSLAAAEAVRQVRDRAFGAFVTDAARASTFYRELPMFQALTAEQTVHPNDLPILARTTVQAHATRIARSDLRAAEIAHTSGSTGTGLRFPVTHHAVARQWATWWRYRRWHGIVQGTWCGYFGGRRVVPIEHRHPPFWRYNVAGRQIVFSGHHISAETWPLYVAELQRRRVPWLHGYPSLLALLAGYLVDRRATIGYDVRWITSGAENLMPSQADLIERAFGVRPRQHYGMAEGVANASECPNGQLHVDEDFAFVEFVPFEAAPGYRIVGTNFTNRAFPLIRYDVGDIAQVSGRTCDCGRPGRIIDRIDGRREDYVVLPTGAMVGRLDHIFKDQVHVREAQIYQPDPTRVVLRIVQTKDFTSRDEHNLISVARSWLGRSLRIEVEHVDTIPRTSAGKLRFVVSDVTSAGLEERPAMADPS